MVFDKNIHADTTDWVTYNEGAGAWIQLDFKQFYEIESLEIRHRSQATAMRFKDIILEFSNRKSQFYTLNDDPMISNKVEERGTKQHRLQSYNIAKNESTK